MAEVTQKGFEITEIRFLKPSLLINVDGKDPIVSRRDHISQILFHTVTIFHVNDSTNLFFKSGGHEKSYAAFIPTTSSSFRYCAVKKHADANSGSDNSPDQNANNANGNNDTVNPNAAPFLEIEHGESSGGNGGDDGNKDGGNADNDGHGRVELHPIRIHRIDVNFIAARTFRPIINTNLIASQYNSWQAFARAIYSIWVQTDGPRNHDNAPAITEMNRYNCWAGAIASFGRYENGKFIHCDWDGDEWEDVKTLIADVRVVRFLPAPDIASQQGNNGQREAGGGNAQHGDGGNHGISILDEIANMCYLVLIVIFVAAIAILVEFLVLLAVDHFRRK